MFQRVHGGDKTGLEVDEADFDHQHWRPDCCRQTFGEGLAFAQDSFRMRACMTAA
jgi:hypothetical protein